MDIRGHDRPVPGAGDVSGSFPHSSRGRRRRVSTRRAERRGRGARGPVLPPQVPRWRSRSRIFDSVVLEAFAEIDQNWHERLSRLDLAVDLIPRMRLGADTDSWPPEVSAAGRVPLARLIPAGVDAVGRPTRARIVLFRKPLEQRATTRAALTDLIHDVLVEQVAVYLDTDPDAILDGP